MARRDCSYAGIVKEGTDTAIISKSENGENSPQTSINTPSSPRAQPSKITNWHWANTTFPQKRGKFDVEIIAEIEDALRVNEGGQTTLL